MGNGQFGVYFVGTPSSTGRPNAVTSSSQNQVISRDYDRVLYKRARFPYSPDSSLTSAVGSTFQYPYAASARAPFSPTSINGNTSLGAHRYATEARYSTTSVGRRNNSSIGSLFSSRDGSGCGCSLNDNTSNSSGFPGTRNLGQAYNRCERQIFNDDFSLNYRESYNGGLPSYSSKDKASDETATGNKNDDGAFCGTDIIAKNSGNNNSMPSPVCCDRYTTSPTADLLKGTEAERLISNVCPSGYTRIGGSPGRNPSKGAQASPSSWILIGGGLDTNKFMPIGRDGQYFPPERSEIPTSDYGHFLNGRQNGDGRIVGNNGPYGKGENGITNSNEYGWNGRNDPNGEYGGYAGKDPDMYGRSGGNGFDNDPYGYGGSGNNPPSLYGHGHRIDGGSYGEYGTNDPNGYGHSGNNQPNLNAYGQGNDGGNGTYDPNGYGGVGNNDPNGFGGNGTYDPNGYGGAGNNDPNGFGRIGTNGYGSGNGGGNGSYDPNSYGESGGGNGTNYPNGYGGSGNGGGNGPYDPNGYGRSDSKGRDPGGTGNAITPSNNQGPSGNTNAYGGLGDPNALGDRTGRSGDGGNVGTFNNGTPNWLTGGDPASDPTGNGSSGGRESVHNSTQYSPRNSLGSPGTDGPESATGDKRNSSTGSHLPKSKGPNATDPTSPHTRGIQTNPPSHKPENLPRKRTDSNTSRNSWDSPDVPYGGGGTLLPTWPDGNITHPLPKLKEVPKNTKPLNSSSARANTPTPSPGTAINKQASPNRYSDPARSPSAVKRTPSKYGPHDSPILMVNKQSVNKFKESGVVGKPSKDAFGQGRRHSDPLPDTKPSKKRLRDGRKWMSEQELKLENLPLTPTVDIEKAISGKSGKRAQRQPSDDEIPTSIVKPTPSSSSTWHDVASILEGESGRESTTGSKSVLKKTTSTHKASTYNPRSSSKNPINRTSENAQNGPKRTRSIRFVGVPPTPPSP